MPAVRSPTFLSCTTRLIRDSGGKRGTPLAAARLAIVARGRLDSRGAAMNGDDGLATTAAVARDQCAIQGANTTRFDISKQQQEKQ